MIDWSRLWRTGGCLIYFPSLFSHRDLIPLNQRVNPRPQRLLVPRSIEPSRLMAVIAACIRLIHGYKLDVSCFEAPAAPVSFGGRRDYPRRRCGSRDPGVGSRWLGTRKPCPAGCLSRARIRMRSWRWRLTKDWRQWWVSPGGCCRDNDAAAFYQEIQCFVFVSPEMTSGRPVRGLAALSVASQDEFEAYRVSWPLYQQLWRPQARSL